MGINPDPVDMNMPQGNWLFYSLIKKDFTIDIEFQIYFFSG